MLDLKRQYESIKDDVAAAVEQVLATQYFIGGPELEAFERESAAYLGVRASLGCSSGTDALWLALAAAGVQPGDRVITPPFTFFASASSITRCGAMPVFADIEPATLNLDPAAVEKLLGGSQPARAIMPVHLYGQCADMDAFAALARKHGVAIIEDAAQAFGASWRGKKAGSLGRVNAFSFYPPRTSAPTAMAEPLPPTIKRWRTTSGGCATMAAASATTTRRSAGTAASTPCRPRCCASS